ncbi:hypothetical protein [Nocardia brasiliensis]|uniref:hypothetical protein n=1 Tax=Nocardia brasiliensis TaxID=37326 RepID=UPI0024562A22|nr:hypothetical protein [Nocardia brasiliensis]
MSVRVFTEDAGRFTLAEGVSVRTEAEFNNLEVVDGSGQIIAVFACWVGACIESGHDG